MSDDEISHKDLVKIIKTNQIFWGHKSVYQIEIRNCQFYPLEIRLSSQYGAQTRLIGREKQEKPVLSESKNRRFHTIRSFVESKPLESII